MNQDDWLVLPSLMCRKCSVELQVYGTEKRPVSEFYVIHPPGICPLASDVVRLDSEGNFIEKLVEGGHFVKHRG